MSTQGFPVAAALQERWFKGMALAFTDDMKMGKKDGKKIDYTALPPEQYLLASSGDKVSPTVAWAKKSVVARQLHDRLVGTWNSASEIDKNGKSRREKTHKLLAERLSSLISNGAPVDNKAGFAIGDMAALAHQQERLYVQTERIHLDLTSDKVDDYFAAFADAQWRLCIFGWATPAKGNKFAFDVSIYNYGVYLFDTYDFLGFQPLGFWNRNGVFLDDDGTAGLLLTAPNIKTAEPSLNDYLVAPDDKYYEVENADYRDYRSATNKGGDFYVFSDIVWHISPQEAAFDGNFEGPPLGVQPKVLDVFLGVAPVL